MRTLGGAIVTLAGVHSLSPEKQVKEKTVKTKRGAFDCRFGPKNQIVCDQVRPIIFFKLNPIFNADDHN